MNTFFRNSLYSRFLWTSICCLRLKSLPKGRPLSVSSGSFQLRFVAWAFLWCIDNKNRWQNSENQELCMNSQKLFKKQNNNHHIKNAWSKHNRNIYQHSSLAKILFIFKKKVIHAGKEMNIVIFNKEKKIFKVLNSACC